MFFLWFPFLIWHDIIITYTFTPPSRSLAWESMVDFTFATNSFSNLLSQGNYTSLKLHMLKRCQLSLWLIFLSTMRILRVAMVVDLISLLWKKLLGKTESDLWSPLRKMFIRKSCVRHINEWTIVGGDAKCCFQNRTLLKQRKRPYIDCCIRFNHVCLAYFSKNVSAFLVYSFITTLNGQL